MHGRGIVVVAFEGCDGTRHGDVPDGLAALFLAALCHDIEHPGVSSSFLLKSRSRMAAWYKDDPGLLEKHHSIRAFELGIAYAQQRVTFGKPIAEHQAVSFRLADMATKVEAAHQMMVMAARKKDSGERNDLESGMAKYLASEYCKEVVEDSFRIHGGYGSSTEYEIERLYREAPMLLIGEGTADIQRMIIGRRLLEEYKART